MIEQEVEEYFRNYNLELISYIGTTHAEIRGGDETIDISFMYKKKIINISFHFWQDNLSVRKDIPSKNKELGKLVEKITGDLLLFLSEVSCFKLKFAFKEPTLHIYGSGYNPIIEKIVDLFYEFAHWIMTFFILTITLIISIYSFNKHWLFGICSIPFSLSLPIIAYAGFKFTMASHPEAAEQAKVQIIYGGIGLILSLISIVLVKLCLFLGWLPQ